MGSLADFTENELLDHVFAGAAYTAPGTHYLGLSTADPTDDASGLAEPSGNAYARTAITWAAAVNGVTSNDAQVQFPTATGAWGNLTHFAVFDAQTGGNMLAHGTLDSPFNVVSGNAPVVEIGDIVIQHSTIAANSRWTNYLIDEVLDHLLGVGSFTAPANIYVALSTTLPDADGANLSEPADAAYSRKVITFGTASNGQCSNDAQAQFAQATESWGTISHFALLDASTGGNMLLRAPFGTAKAVGVGNAPLIAVGGMTLGLN